MKELKVKAMESDGWSVRVVAFCDKKRCGELEALRQPTKVDGRNLMIVDIAEVDEAHQRKGVGTKLYEIAAAEACKHGALLASRSRSKMSDGFWKKQIKKGRAKVVEGKTIALVSCSIDTLSGLKSRSRKKRAKR